MLGNQNKKKRKTKAECSQDVTDMFCDERHGTVYHADARKARKNTNKLHRVRIELEHDLLRKQN